MDNRDRVIKETAKRVGMPMSVVRLVVGSPLLLAKAAIVNKTPRSVYLRKVGTLLSPEIRLKIRGYQKEAWAQKKIKALEEENQ